MIYLSILVVAIGFVLFSCDSTKNNTPTNLVTITGEITNPTGDSVWISPETAFGRNFKAYGAVVDSTGHFEISFNVVAPSGVNFFDGNEGTEMFVKPGDRIHLTLDTKAFDETIQYSGSASVENNYLAKKYLAFDDKGAFFIYDMRDSLGIDGGIEYVDSLKQARVQFLEAFLLDHKNVSPEFIRTEKTNIEFQLPNLLIQYTYNRGIDSTLDKIMELFSSYMDEKPLDSSSVEYTGYLNQYPIYLMLEHQELLKNKHSQDSVLLELIIANSNGNARNKMIAERFENSLLDYNIDYFEENRTVFDKYVTIDIYREHTLSRYQKALKALEAKLPTDVQLINLENEKFNHLTYQAIIDRYKGKVIYLDFWASWCVPCKAEMPFSLNLQKQFKGKEVAFVYFSSDADSVAWKNMVKILQISGDHYRLNKAVTKVTNALFDVQFIPRYILIDKNGIVVDAAAKRPSEPEIVEEIKKLL